MLYLINPNLEIVCLIVLVSSGIGEVVKRKKIWWKKLAKNMVEGKQDDKMSSLWLIEPV